MSRADGKKNQSQLQNLGRVWRLLFRQMPGSVFLVILCSVLLSFRNPIELIFQKNIVDKTVQATSSGFTLSALLPVFLGYIAFELFSIVLISTFPALRNYWTGIDFKFSLLFISYHKPLYHRIYCHLCFVYLFIM